MQLSLTARAIFSGARAGGRAAEAKGEERGRAAHARARARAEGERRGDRGGGYRALAASSVAIIIIYRAPSTCFLSASLSLLLPPHIRRAIILVRATTRPSAGTDVSRASPCYQPPPLPPPLPSSCRASQIELISGIYRAADFPFVLAGASARTGRGDAAYTSLSVGRVSARALRLRSICVCARPARHRVQ